ncbi:MAG: alpha/beta hydrolase, partial [Azonexus sp.]|nr:alpha/beta hydrolase [Azonexus sp.]
QQAVSEMALPETRFSIRRHKLPVLVIGGMDDAVFPASMLHFLASAWRADLYRAAGTGHMLMLEARWETVAEHMLRWLDKRVSA